MHFVKSQSLCKMTKNIFTLLKKRLFQLLWTACEKCNFLHMMGEGSTGWERRGKVKRAQRDSVRWHRAGGEVSLFSSIFSEWVQTFRQDKSQFVSVPMLARHGKVSVWSCWTGQCILFSAAGVIIKIEQG